MLYGKEKEINIYLQENLFVSHEVETCFNLSEFTWMGHIIGKLWGRVMCTWLDTRTHTVSLHAVLSTNVPGTSVCGFSCMFCPLLFSQHQYLWELQHIFPLKNSKAWICHQHLFGLCYMQRLTLKTKI